MLRAKGQFLGKGILDNPQYVYIYIYIDIYELLKLMPNPILNLKSFQAWQRRHQATALSVSAASRQLYWKCSGLGNTLERKLSENEGASISETYGKATGYYRLPAYRLGFKE